MKVDYLIIGQGLAGSLLAWQLMQCGKRVIVVDNGMLNASKVAAGLINPVTGKRLVKAKNTALLLQSAVRFYRQLSEFFDCHFYTQMPMLRILRDKTELQYCQTRLADADYQDYLAYFIPAGQVRHKLCAPLGILIQKQTGYLLCETLLQKLRDFFITRNSYRQCELDYRDIAIHNEHGHWLDIDAHRIIFCEGFQCSNNPWFGKLPLQPVKGEILNINSNCTLPECIVNYGHWMIPLNPGSLRTGATYDHENPDNKISSAGKQRLLAELKKSCPEITLGKVTAHQAGIRPCTLDKHPFIGFHPHYRCLAVFNGFGSKGSLQIPWHASSFCETLLRKTPLPQSADVSRYYASHFPS